eukprot:gene14539-20579_t
MASLAARPSQALNSRVGDTMRCLGAATRSKKFLIVSVQVYSVAAFAEAEKCAKELGKRQRGGFFETDDDYMTAVLDGAFHKAVVVHLVRDVDGPTFAKALNDTLVPRMTLAGETDKLAQFSDHISARNLAKGTEVLMLWNVVMLWNVGASTLEVSVVPPGGAGPSSYSTMTPEITIDSLALCRGMFETFMGSASVTPTAKAAWVKGAKNLLESDNVKRNL